MLKFYLKLFVCVYVHVQTKDLKQNFNILNAERWIVIYILNQTCKVSFFY